MHSKSENTEFMPYDNANNDVNERFESLHFRYQIGLETSIRGTVYTNIFDSVQLLCYKCYKINFKQGGSYINSPDWIKKKKATINPKKEDDRCFHYAATVALYHKEVKRDPQRISKIKDYEKEVTNIDKDGSENVITISYKIKFIYSARYMASS